MAIVCIAIAFIIGPPGCRSVLGIEEGERADASTPGDGVDTGPPSCAGGLSCNSESCCMTLSVTGGSFARTFDGVAGCNDGKFKATISSFRLDKYEVTVGRFRNFVDAVVRGWRPVTGEGRHQHLNGEKGLANALGGYEYGWYPAWNGYLSADRAMWSTGLSACKCADMQTWTADPGPNENAPITQVNWYQAYAFCIWDGGFLPSEAEWEFVAAAETEQRKYPWGSTEPGNDTVLAVHDCWYKGGGPGTCSGTSVLKIAPVGSTPKGNGRLGHADLAGNVFEWVLDVYRAPFAETVCLNCAYVPTSGTDASERVCRGGSYRTTNDSLRVCSRPRSDPTRTGDLGIRCARRP